MKQKNSYQKVFKAALATTVATGALVATVPAYTQAEEADTKSFPDVKVDDYFYEAVMDLTEREIIRGFPDGDFKPHNQITRGQAAKILAMVLDLDTENVEDPGFTDVKKTDEYYGPIAALAQAGIINGYPDKTFGQANTLTRSQMAKIIVKGFELPVEELTDDRFEDVKEGDEFAGYVQTLLTHEITVGTTDTTFSPAANVSRSQLALFVTRAEGAVVTPDPVPEPTDAELLAAAITEIDEIPDWMIVVSKGEEASDEAKELALKDFVEELLDNSDIEVAIIKAAEEGAYTITLTKGEESEETTINDVTFEVTEQEAVNAKFVADLETAVAGETITLTHNVSVSEPVMPAAGVTIDGAGFELNVATEGDGATTAEGVLLGEDDITLKNIIITGTHDDNLIEIYNNATLENVTVKGSKKAGIYVNNIEHANMIVNFRNITTADNTWAGIGISANDTLTVNASFTGEHSFGETPAVYTEGTNAGKGTMTVTGLSGYTKLDSGTAKTDTDVKEGQTKQVWYLKK